MAARISQKKVHDLLSVKVQTGNNKNVGFYGGELEWCLMIRNDNDFSGKNDGEWKENGSG